ncbi:hypothetical protein NECAME_17543 [Necator americanus]|uniref:Glycosyl hydrolase family 25 n=1 Tax=Necator americanus TaxID=51031 RepID=W2TNH2_NECAM|nr:hypothetical protein NECAME_17543 [Necator americanus]ETN83224.1 hypothetical protein NECAME_17543 [Necator americanus]
MHSTESVWCSVYQGCHSRGYSPAGQGQLDPYACANIQNANLAGLGTEVYMTPLPFSTKTGIQQFDEMYGGLKNANINVRSIWVQVTSPVNWYSSSTTNINFLNSILSRASQYGLSIGIYTSVYDWNQITGGATVSNAMLWYWNVYGSGVTNESPADYSDFRSFGGWTTPTVKQFAQVETVCGVTVNRCVVHKSLYCSCTIDINRHKMDIYTVSSTSKSASMAKFEKSGEIVVGNFGLENVGSGKVEIKQ